MYSGGLGALTGTIPSITAALQALSAAMAAENIQGTLSAQQAILGWTTGGPYLVDPAYRAALSAAGLTSADIDTAYRVASNWLNTRASQISAALGPGYTQLGPGTGTTNTQISVSQAQQNVATQQAQEAALLASNNLTLQTSVRRGLARLGWSSAVIDAEIARLNTVLGGVWPIDGSAWGLVSPALLQGNSGSLAPTTSYYGGVAPPGSSFLPVSSKPPPGSPGGVPSSGGGMIPSDAGVEPETIPGPGVLQAGGGGLGLLAIVGLVVGAMVLSAKGKRSHLGKF